MTLRSTGYALENENVQMWLESFRDTGELEDN